jgi:hypothetical protein
MPGISPQALAGYILEEMLAYLLRNAGYRLLTDESQDPHELANRHHGLIVRGRGAEHQVDVLGELSWIPAFTYPLRLVLEAKCRIGKTDIATVRNMVATLLDINQNNMPSRLGSGAAPMPRAKYAYVGAIFSASGFSSHAADFALAHAISLIDLGTTVFSSLVAAAGECAAALNAHYDEQRSRSAARFVKAVRDSLRRELGTAPKLQEDLISDLGIPRRPLEIAMRAARRTDELFVGMAFGPHMLVLKADDPKSFLRYAAELPTHEVTIHWSEADDDGKTWSIVPRHDAGAYRLSFKLPERLAAWIFGAENVRRAALSAKPAFFSSITIYRRDERQDRLIRLIYDPSHIGDEKGAPVVNQ